MPKSFATDTLAFSIRLQPATAKWLEEQARKIGSFNQAVRDIVDDARTLYRLPSLRAAQLLKGEISLPGKGSRPPKR